MQEYLDLWRNYFDFSGRTSRRGYWMAFLFNFLISLVLGWVAELIGLGFLSSVYSLAVFIPTLAIAIRRLRDAGKHWAWYFINLIPLVGQIVFIIFLCQPSVAAPAKAAAYDEYEY